MSGWRWLARSAALYAQPASWLVETSCSSVNPVSVQVVGDLTIYARTRTFPYSSMYHDPSMITSIVYLLTVLIFLFFSRFARVILPHLHTTLTTHICVHVHVASYRFCLQLVMHILPQCAVHLVPLVIRGFLFFFSFFQFSVVAMRIHLVHVCKRRFYRISMLRLLPKCHDQGNIFRLAHSFDIDEKVNWTASSSTLP